MQMLKCKRFMKIIEIENAKQTTAPNTVIVLSTEKLPYRYITNFISYSFDKVQIFSNVSMVHFYLTQYKLMVELLFNTHSSVKGLTFFEIQSIYSNRLLLPIYSLSHLVFYQQLAYIRSTLLTVIMEREWNSKCNLRHS